MTDFRIGQRVIVQAPQGGSACRYNGTEGVIRYRTERNRNFYGIGVTRFVWWGETRTSTVPYGEIFLWGAEMAELELNRSHDPQNQEG